MAGKSHGVRKHGRSLIRMSEWICYGRFRLLDGLSLWLFGELLGLGMEGSIDCLREERNEGSELDLNGWERRRVGRASMARENDCWYWWQWWWFPVETLDLCFVVAVANWKIVFPCYTNSCSRKRILIFPILSLFLHFACADWVSSTAHYFFGRK